MRGALKASIVVAAIAAHMQAVAARAMASDEKPQSALTIQCGWWSVEAEWKAKSGVFAAVGVPWVAVALTPSAKWLIPYGARIGYQRGVSRVFRVRGAAHVAGTYGRENPCGDCGEIVSRTFGFVEIGGRYEAPSGFVAGVDVPIFALGKNVRDIYPPPLSFAFSQVYVGFSWRW
jgi:hypothetical protein